MTQNLTTNPTTITTNVTFSGVAVYGNAGTNWTVVNAATIKGTGGGAGKGISLGGSGSVVNTAAGYIYGYQQGVDIAGSGLVANSGTISGHIKAVGMFGGGDSVNNSGLIEGGEGIFLESGAVSNTGTIAATSLAVTYYGIALESGSVGNTGTAALIEGGRYAVGIAGHGTVTNTAGLIESRVGIQFFGDNFGGSRTGTVSNSGTILGTSGNGIYLGGGGSVGNTGLIRGSIGIDVENAPATVTNTGTIAGTSNYGIDLAGGGTVTDDGTIAGATGTAVAFGGNGANLLVLDPGYTLGGKVVGSTTAGATNTLELAAGGGGTVTAALSAQFVNFDTITVDPGANWTLTGSGTLGTGVTLTDLGTLTAVGTLTNDGTIFDDGEFILPSGTLVNNGHVYGAVTLAGNAYLDNAASGLISSVASAVTGAGNGVRVFNAGTIVSTVDGISLQSGGTVIDSGTIGGASGTAIYFGGFGANRLALLPGAVILGEVVGSTVFGATNTLELASAASAGTIAASLSAIVNFDTITVDTGANWTLTGGGVIGAGVTLNDFGTLTDFGVLTNDGTVLAANGELIVSLANVYNNNYVSGSVTLTDFAYLKNTGTITAHGNAVLGTLSGNIGINNLGLIFDTAAGGAGIYIVGAGLVSNGAAGLIQGGFYGVKIGGPAQAVSNSGAIYGTSRYGVLLENSGYVGNTGAAAVIKGGFTGVGIKGGLGTVTNTGAIYGTSRYGVLLAAGGTVNNTGGVIQGALGVEIKGGAGTVNNTGGIYGTSRYGVQLQAGGYVGNAGVIQGTLGVSIKGGLGYVYNTGNIYGTTRYGIYLQKGGTVTDAGRISGADGTAIYFGGSGNNLLVLDPGYKLNGKVIGSTTAGAINQLDLAPGASAGKISGAALTSDFVNFTEISVDPGASWSVTGDGTIGSGVSLVIDGTFTDVGTLTNAGFMDVLGEFVVGAATFVNRNYVTGSVTLTNGSYLLNALHGTITSAAGDAVYGAPGATSAPTIVNLGTITAGEFVNDGIDFRAGGLVANYNVIAASSDGGAGANYGDGVYVTGGAGTIGNFHYIGSTQHHGVALADGGFVYNAATGGITGHQSGVFGGGAPVYVTNYGAICGVNGDGVEFHAGGYVYNAPVYGSHGPIPFTGLILGGANGVYITGGLGDVVNFGTIVGAGNDGVDLLAGGSAYNAAIGLIQGNFDGVFGNSAAVSVYNYGAIYSTAGFGVNLAAGGSIRNGGGSITAGVTIAGYSAGVRVGSSGPDLTTATVANYGAIEATGTSSGYGIEFYDSGQITNGSTSDTTASITGYTDGLRLGIYSPAPTSTVTNYGTIAATALSGGYGVILGDGGNLRNGATNSTLATIAGSRYGISDHGGTIANYGTIIGGDGTDNAGVRFTALGPNALINGAANDTAAVIGGYEGVYLYSGMLTNFGTIASMAGIGVDVTQGGTVIDFGTITGGSGTAVSFGGITNRLVLYPGFVLGGNVIGSSLAGATNTLELASAASAGTISAAFSAQFLNFGTIVVDTGANWTVAGNRTLPVGITLTDLGTLTDAGTLTNNGILNDTGGEFIVTDTFINNGSVYGNVTVANGGVERVSGFSASTTVDAGGSETLENGAMAGTTDISGGRVEVTGNVPVAGEIDFSGGGALQLDNSAGFTGVIAGFGLPDQIDLRDISFGAKTSAQFIEFEDGTQGTLDVTDGTHLAQLVLLGSYAPGQFSLSSDGDGGTLVTDPPVSAAIGAAGNGMANDHDLTFSSAMQTKQVQPGEDFVRGYDFTNGDKLDLTNLLAGASLAPDLNFFDFVDILGSSPNDFGYGPGTQTTLQVSGPGGQATVHLEGSGSFTLQDLVTHNSLILPPR